MIKKRNLLAVLILPFLAMSCSFGNKNANSGVQANIDEEVKACFEQVNNFRTGSEAWYWNSDNSTKTSVVGKREKLVLDEELCRAAQIRANEIVKSFSHTRPDGQSCFTVLKECSIVYSGCGENIAAGNKGGVDTFVQWKEDNFQYAGQGHRRNMLGDYKKIGIARAYDPNSTYKYYWAMELVK